MEVVSFIVSPVDLLSRRRSLPARSTNDTCAGGGWGGGVVGECDGRLRCARGASSVEQGIAGTHSPGREVLPVYLAVARHAKLVVFGAGGSGVNVDWQRRRGGAVGGW